MQVVRDGRDTVAAMLADPVAMSWFRPGVVNIDTPFPNPFYGVEDESDRLPGPPSPTWASARCAGGARSGWRRGCGWRWPTTSSRRSATRTWPATLAGQQAALTDFIGTKIAAPITPTTKRAKIEQNAWRRSLSYGQLAEVEKVWASEELRRLGYR